MSRTESFFNKYSVGFDSIYGKHSKFNSLINHFLRAGMRQRFELTMKECDPIEGKTVLDVGCGPGHYSITLALRGAKKVLGIDFAEQMIKLSQEKAKQNKVSQNCTFKIADFFSLDDNEQFDFLVIMGFMDYIEDAETMIKKVYQLTKEKAVLSFPYAHGFLAWQRRIRYKSKCPLYMYSKKDIESILEKLNIKKYSLRKIHRDYFLVIEK